MFDYELEQPEAPDDEDGLEFDDGNGEEAAEEIELLVRCVHAARMAGV